MGCGGSHCHRQLYAGAPVYFKTGCAQPPVEIITTSNRRCNNINIPLVPVTTINSCGIGGGIGGGSGRRGGYF